ncbi:unnamed protein product, partial [Bubo scandiacus]
KTLLAEHVFDKLLKSSSLNADSGLKELSMYSLWTLLSSFLPPFQLLPLAVQPLPPAVQLSKKHTVDFQS